MRRNHHERTPCIQRWEMIYRRGNPGGNHVAVHRDANALSRLKTRPCYRRQRQLARRDHDAPGRTSQRLFPPDRQAVVSGTRRVHRPLRAVGNRPALREGGPRPHLLKSFYHDGTARQCGTMRRYIVERQAARRRARERVPRKVQGYHPPTIIRRYGPMFSRQRRHHVLPRFALAELRGQQPHLQVAVSALLVANAHPQAVSGQRHCRANVLPVVAPDPDSHPLRARRQCNTGGLRREGAAQRGQQSIQRCRLPLDEIVPPPGSMRHGDGINSQDDSALRSAIYEPHRLPNHRRDPFHPIDGVQSLQAFLFRAAQEACAAQHYVPAGAVAGLVRFAACQRGLERAGEYPQRRRQRNHHGQRCVRQRVAGHPPQG